MLKNLFYFLAGAATVIVSANVAAERHPEYFNTKFQEKFDL